MIKNGKKIKKKEKLFYLNLILKIKYKYYD